MIYFKHKAMQIVQLKIDFRQSLTKFESYYIRL